MQDLLAYAFVPVNLNPASLGVNTRWVTECGGIVKPKSICQLLAAVSVAAAANNASGDIVTNTSTQTTAYTVSNTDLLQQPGVTHVNRDATGAVLSDTDTLFTYVDGNNGNTVSLGVPALTNGAFGLAGRPQADGEYAGIKGQNTGTSGNPLTITYTLDTSVNTAGYNLTGIDLYTGWADNGRDNINTAIAYSTVAAPTVFIPLTTVTYGPAGTSPIDDLASLTDTTGTVASGVKSIQFGFPVQENTGVAYREIDVFGSAAPIPEPGSVGLLTMGAMGLLSHRRRRA